MRSMHSWPMSDRRRCEILSLCALANSLRDFCQDFAAAEEKALKVGAKKFFLEVRDVLTIIMILP